MKQYPTTFATQFAAFAAALFLAGGAFAAEPVKVETENTMLLFELERSDAGDVRELLLMPLTEVFLFQLEAHRGEGLVLNPYTDPLWIPNGMLPILLDAGRHRM